MRTLLLVLTFSSFQAFGQTIAPTEEDAVKATINRFFEGMKKGDSSLIRSSVSGTAVLQTVVTRNGTTEVRNEDMNDFIRSVTRPHNEVYDERIQFDMIRIDADLAIAWTPYRFYIGQTFSHCGVNSFQLVRFNGQWKIQYIIDTRRKQPCP